MYLLILFPVLLNNALCYCKQKLKEKAAFRNPDEFYFKMVKTKTINGVHRPQ